MLKGAWGNTSYRGYEDCNPIHMYLADIVQDLAWLSWDLCATAWSLGGMLVVVLFSCDPALLWQGFMKEGRHDQDMFGNCCTNFQWLSIFFITWRTNKSLTLSWHTIRFFSIDVGDHAASGGSSHSSLALLINHFPSNSCGTPVNHSWHFYVPWHCGWKWLDWTIR